MDVGIQLNPSVLMGLRFKLSRFRVPGLAFKFSGLSLDSGKGLDAKAQTTQLLFFGCCRYLTGCYGFKLSGFRVYRFWVNLLGV